MALAFPRTPRRLARAALDVAVVLWAVAWIVVGLLVAREVDGLTDLSRTVSSAGVALEEAGRALQEVERVPFVGENVGAVGERTEQAGQSAQASGRSSRESVESLSVLLGISIALAPSLPLLALYVPMRIRWIRQVRSVRRALAREPDDGVLDQLLAARASLNLPLDRVRAMNGDPRRLADAELERLGLSRRRRTA